MSPWLFLKNDHTSGCFHVWQDDVGWKSKHGVQPKATLPETNSLPMNLDVCKVSLYGLYHGKIPSNHHLGEYVWNFFPSILSKSKWKLVDDWKMKCSFLGPRPMFTGLFAVSFREENHWQESPQLQRVYGFSLALFDPPLCAGSKYIVNQVGFRLDGPYVGTVPNMMMSLHLPSWIGHQNSISFSSSS